MAEMARRAPGSNELSTPRKETDQPIFMSGLMDGMTTGAPITAVVRNSDQHSSAYDPKIPRPSHADLAAWVRFRGMNDYRGGGHFSGRLTAGWVVAGAICRQELARRGIEVSARIVRIATHPDVQGMGYGRRALQQLQDYFQGRVQWSGEEEAPLEEEAPQGLDAEAKPRKHLPPLLVSLADRKPERLHVGVRES